VSAVSATAPAVAIDTSLEHQKQRLGGELRTDFSCVLVCIQSGKQVKDLAVI
jgi:hypothetical protein